MSAALLRIALAALHLLALGIGLGAVWARARALGDAVQAGSGGADRSAASGAAVAALRRAFAADALWGAAAVLWISTGLWRLLAGTEKATAYYWGNHVFLAKMGFLLVILALEVWPATTLVRWRAALGRGALADWEAPARRIAVLSYVQVALTVAMVWAAVMMARGYE